MVLLRTTKGYQWLVFITVKHCCWVEGYADVSKNVDLYYEKWTWVLVDVECDCRMAG
jgi:hypothetical protein